MARRVRRHSAGRRRRPKAGVGIWCGLGVVAAIGGYGYLLANNRPELVGTKLRYDTFVALAEQHQLRDAVVLDADTIVVGHYTADNGSVARYYSPYLKGANATKLVDVLSENRIPTTIEQQPLKDFFNGQATLLLAGLLSALAFLYFAVSFKRGTGMFSTGSGARRPSAIELDVTFADVAGQDAAVAELRDIVDFLSEPERFEKVGAVIPRGVLLYGPPGCGKTLLAKALAAEAGAAFFSISGSDFMELYVGVGAARVRELFAEARAVAPAIVFIDELDSIGRARGLVKTVASSGEQEQALNQILFEMDGFQARSGVLVVGATNRPDVLDAALLRPGRFDRTVGLERPDEAGRLAILSVHAGRRPFAPDVDLSDLASRALGLTGADLANVVNEAALLAGRAGQPLIAGAQLDVALARVLEAPERQRRLSMRDRQVSHRYTSGADRVTFEAVGGIDEVLEEFQELKSYLADPERFARMDVQLPRGVLLSGPPGCGKTLLARALAGEANAAFLYVAATEFVEVFVGEGAARVRDLFAEARALAPSIVFIDELDAIGARRSTVSASGNREQEQTLNQILVELDGFSSHAGVIVMAATNRADILDPALTRPGRFDLHITINQPSRTRRREILAIHSRRKPLGPDVDLDVIAALTQGFSGAALARVMSEALLLAARRGSGEITMPLIDEAIERTARGISSVSHVLNDDERRTAAYHEVGHALVGHTLDGGDTPHRISILPMGDALGATWNAGSDRVIHPRSVLLDRMAAMFGGRAAEELVFGEAGSGSADDLERATRLARRMVCELGMSKALGPMVCSPAEGLISEETAQLVDAEVRHLLAEAHDMATSVLSAKRSVLDAAAVALVEREVMTGEEFVGLVALGGGNAKPERGSLRSARSARS